MSKEMNIEEAIETVKEIKNLQIAYYRPTTYTTTYMQKIKFYLNEEQRQAIETVLRALEDYREDYNHRCQLAIDRKIQLDNSISKDKIKEKIEEIKNSNENYTFEKLTSRDIRRTIITNLQELLGKENSDA